MLVDKCLDLLTRWSERLLSLQIHDTGNLHLDGGLSCPSCGMIHGRCVEAMYPFITMASVTGDNKWIEASEDLFSWAEHNVLLDNGLFLNDIDVEWKGTTVFTTIQLCDCLIRHELILSDSFRTKIKNCIRKAAESLSSFEALKSNNVNYPFSNALALYEAWIVTGDEIFKDKSSEFLDSAKDAFLPDGLIAGEGCPRSLISPRGCNPVDIGYNVEETLVSLARLSILKDDVLLQDKVQKSLLAHLMFMLPDGAWDNSFGTRNFKWSYWGSRTTDGSAEAFLLFADKSPVFKTAAWKHIELLDRTTSSDNLLLGGPDYEKMDQLPCIHHTFTHAKILASVIDNGIADIDKPNLLLPRFELNGIRTFDSIATSIATFDGYTVTISGYDWRYTAGDHSSGGTITMLYGNEAGPVIAAGMREYHIVEKNNMQSPKSIKHHECMIPRIEYTDGGILYSSMNDGMADIEINDNSIIVNGVLKNADCDGDGGKYSFIYHFYSKSFVVDIYSEKGVFILPFISSPDDDVFLSNRLIRRHGVSVTSSEDIEYPYSSERIFNLIPGFSAIRADIKMGKFIRLKFDFS